MTTTDDLVRAPRPTTSYADALARFEQLLSQDSPAIDPKSQAQLLTPGHATQRAVIFFHGLSNSPQQFSELAARFVAREYSVFIPRIPYHGYLDRMSVDHAKLTVADLVDVTAESIDLAAGLANHLTVTGISLGGVLAMWAAQYRNVGMVAPIAPAMGFPVLPYAMTGPVMQAVGRLPNRFVWWDPRYKERLPGPDYAYPRFATHALVATQVLARRVLQVALTQRPTAERIWLISNEADLAVSNSAGMTLFKRWRATAGANVNMYRFPRQLKLTHDIVDPHQPSAHPDITYPALEQIIIDGSAPGLSGFSTGEQRLSRA